jgi:hypothetical protein
MGKKTGVLRAISSVYLESVFQETLQAYGISKGAFSVDDEDLANTCTN